MYSVVSDIQVGDMGRSLRKAMTHAAIMAKQVESFIHFTRPKQYVKTREKKNKKSQKIESYIRPSILQNINSIQIHFIYIAPNRDRGYLHALLT